MDPIVVAILAIGGCAIGAAATFLALQVMARGQMRRARDDADQLAVDARREVRELTLVAEREALERRREVDTEGRLARRELAHAERRLQQRDEGVDRRTAKLELAEQAVQDRAANLEMEKRTLDERASQITTNLEEIAQLTTQAARDQLLERLDLELRDESARQVRAMEASAKLEGDRRARKMLATVMQRMTSELTAETTVSSIPLTSDDLKGRIIGREGRNIRAFEAATGCDVIIDDTPGSVTVAGFDPVRREIARLALSRLVQDGRIQPLRIEESVERARKEIGQAIQAAGEQLVVEAGVAGLHPEVVKTLGRLKFRYSYGQNQLRHVLETSWLATALAHELGADVEVARMGGLLHDLGKAVDREMEGTHALIGADIARRFGVQGDVVHCIEAHHEEVKPETVEALIVICADAMSGSRPGARRESADQYIRRLETLEAIANSFDGVSESFAIQAGREVRIIVQPDSIDDLQAARLARNVSRKIEESVQYPGQIKVTVIRETRATSVAH